MSFKVDVSHLAGQFKEFEAEVQAEIELAIHIDQFVRVAALAAWINILHQDLGPAILRE